MTKLNQQSNKSPTLQFIIIKTLTHNFSRKKILQLQGQQNIISIEKLTSSWLQWGLFMRWGEGKTLLCSVAAFHVPFHYLVPCTFSSTFPCFGSFGQFQKSFFCHTTSHFCQVIYLEQFMDWPSRSLAHCRVILICEAQKHRSELCKAIMKSNLWIYYLFVCVVMIMDIKSFWYFK